VTGNQDPQDPPTVAGRRAPSRTSRALGVEVEVLPVKGQWAVDIVVIFPDGVVRQRIATYSTEARARISARCIKRGAERDISGPIHG
jgi:hypothetical protein